VCGLLMNRLLRNAGSVGGFVVNSSSQKIWLPSCYNTGARFRCESQHIWLGQFNTLCADAIFWSTHIPRCGC
jgi:hypothetical protein